MGRFDSYSGLLSAYPYAFGRSDSRLFKSYALVSGLLAGLFAFMMVAAVLVLLGNTEGARGGTLTLSRTFYVVVGLFVFVPLVAPVLLVARRHRRDTPVDSRYDPALAAAGYLFVLSVYAGLVASMPETFTTNGETVARPEPAGLLAPVVEALYSIPPVASPLLVLAGGILVYLAHRRFR
ncbi:hypothetical protein [Halobacterium zhouii]|uniref:hypothetical protein n=1 Tax=Halobacterium zhouii TaxID=2902624 RepID=UPI001E2FC657|nr:hypothetical protein [Halobacterium zhouii]